MHVLLPRSYIRLPSPVPISGGDRTLESRVLFHYFRVMEEGFISLFKL